MTAQYGRYSPLAPRTMSQNRNSAISSPRTRTPAGTNTGLTNPMQSSIGKQLNIPTPTAPGGHRQVPFGGRTTSSGFNPNQGRSAVNSNEKPSYGVSGGSPYGSGYKSPVSAAGPSPQSESLSPQNPMVMDTFQQQLARGNQIQNRGAFSMPIPRGNPQSPPPQGIYNRPSGGARY